MAFCGTGKVVVPDIVEGGVEADAFEAVIVADGPAVLAGKGWKRDLGEVLEVGDGGGHSGSGVLKVKSKEGQIQGSLHFAALRSR